MDCKKTVETQEMVGKTRKLKMHPRRIKDRERNRKISTSIKRIGALMGVEDQTQQQIMDEAKRVIPVLKEEEKQHQKEIAEMDLKILQLQQTLAQYGQYPMVCPPVMQMFHLGQPTFNGNPQQPPFSSPESEIQTQNDILPIPVDNFDKEEDLNEEISHEPFLKQNRDSEPFIGTIPCNHKTMNDAQPGQSSDSMLQTSSFFGTSPKKETFIDKLKRINSMYFHNASQQ